MSQWYSSRTWSGFFPFTGFERLSLPCSFPTVGFSSWCSHFLHHRNFLGNNGGTHATFHSCLLILSPGSDAMMASVIAAVFSGAVFGDHCSPMSDTTIVSAVACEISPYDHFRTQLPYALLAASVAAFAGFIPLGLESLHGYA